MYVKEFDSFVKKLYQLWNDGLTAHLDLDTQAGNDWAGLHVQLGHVPGHLYQQLHPYHQHVHRKGESPARQWRHGRHAAAQGNTEKARETDDETEKVTEKVADIAEELVTAENKGKEGDSVEETLIVEQVGISAANDESNINAEEADNDCVYFYSLGQS